MFWKEFSLTFVEEKTLDITKGIIQSVLSLLLQSVFVHVCERKRERKRGGEKDGQTSKIIGIKYTGEKEAPSFFHFLPVVFGEQGEMEAGNRLLQFHLRVARLACQVIITMKNAGEKPNRQS